MPVCASALGFERAFLRNQGAHAPVLSWWEWPGGAVVQSLLRERASFRRATKLYWALVFLVVAIIAGILGFWGLAATAAVVGKIILMILQVIVVVSLLVSLAGGGWRRGPPVV